MAECVVVRHQRRDGNFVPCQDGCPLTGWRGTPGDEQWDRPWDDGNDANVC